MPPHEEYFVIARSTFGDLIIWGTIYGRCLKISFVSNQIFLNMEKMEQGEDGFSRQYFKAGEILPEIKNQDWGEVY